MALDDQIHELLKVARTIAVVGLSEKTWRPSHDVAAYLQSVGYTIVPINPAINTVLGVSAYPDLLTAACARPIDIVDIFRRPEFVPDLVE